MNNFTKTITAFLFPVILAGCFTSLYAQRGTVAAGGQATGPGGTVSYSIGQVDYIDITSAGGNISQGLQQVTPVAPKTLAPQKQLPPEITMDAIVYPNPAKEYVTLAIRDKLAQTLSYALYTADGRLVSAQKISGNQQNVSLAGLAGGVYFLVIQNNGTRLKSFTIIKTQ